MSTCYADPDPNIQPAMRLISSITREMNAVVTTTFNHNYVSGTMVRFNIPRSVGMSQINKKVGIITVTGADTFTVDIDTTNYDAFSIPVSPSWHDNTCALIVPIGQVSNQLTAAVQDVT